MGRIKKILKESLEHAHIAAEKTGSKWGGVTLSLLDIYWCILRYGARPRDYTMFEFYYKNHAARNKYMTIGRYFKMLKSFDQDVFKRLSGKKDYEYKLFKDFIKRDWMYVGDETPTSSIEDFVTKHPDLIAKPNNGEQGHGIFRVKGFNSNGFNRLISRKQGESFILEETVINCPEIAAINDSSLNTVRVYTLKQKDGKVRILAAMLRTGRKDSLVDNWGSGGIGYYIDVKTGICDRYGLDKKSQPYMFHPDSNVQMIGYKMPYWDELIDYIYRISAVEPKATFVGWDVAISSKGLDLIEMNFPGGHDFLQAFGIARWDEIKSCLK